MAGGAGWLLLATVCLQLQGIALSLTNGDLRLTGIGSNKFAGRLEVFYEGQWGSVCGGDSLPTMNFDMLAAQVACKQMGLGFAVGYASLLHLPEQRFRYGHGSGPIFLSDVNCFGDDILNSHILQCTYGDIGPDFTGHCDHTMDVILQCSNLTTPYDGEIRLSRSPALPAEVLHTPSSGVVELYNNGEWKGVCLDDISMATADALCRQLGYSESNRTELLNDHTLTNIWQHDSLNCMEGAVCINSCLQQFPVSSGTSCQAHLLHCKFVGDNFNFDSRFGSRTACSVSATPPDDKSVRLVSDSSIRQRVDVYVNGSWGSLCSRTFSGHEAEVVCKQSGFPTFTGEVDTVSEWVANGVPRGTGHIYDMRCTGLESHVSNCVLTPSTECQSHDDDVVVRCSSLITPYGSIALHSVSGTVGGASGTLVLFNGTEFQPVCDAGFTAEHARVVCRQLGYATGRHTPNSIVEFTPDNRLILPDFVQLTHSCTGSESHLLSCDSSPLLTQHDSRQGFVQVTADSTECRQGLDEVGIVCDSGDLEFRVRNGAGANEGRLEVNYNGRWGRVCGAGFGSNEALVACRSLGFESLLYTEMRPSVSGSAVLASGVSCFGVEDSLLQCNISLDNEVQCPTEESVWVECGSTSLPSDGNLRLISLDDGPNATNQSGRLEISVNNEWLSVCGSLFSEEAAQVACRQLGFSMAAHHCTDACYGQGSNGIYFSEDNCLGDEYQLLDCPMEYHSPSRCDHSLDVGLFCVDRLIFPTSSPEATGLSPKEGFPMYVYYIIAGAAGGLLLLAVVVGVVCCACCCHRRWRNKHQGTWTSTYSNNRTGQGSYHNGVVCDISNLGREKEEGFDDPKETVKMNGALSAYNHTPSTRHDVILHALNHSLEEEGEGYATPQTKVRGQSNGVHHVHHNGSNGIGNGTAMRSKQNGIRVEHRDFDSSSSTEIEVDIADIPSCPPPDYNELFHSKASGSDVPNGHVTGCRGNSCHGSSGEEEKKKRRV